MNNTWVEIQRAQSNIKAEAKATAKPTTRRGRTRRAGGNLTRNIIIPTTTTTTNSAGGILGIFGARFNRSQSVNYTALHQGDLEEGAGGNIKSNKNCLSLTESESSSSEEDLFPARSSHTSPPRRKLRRKMGKGRNVRRNSITDDDFVERRKMGNRTNATASCEDLLLEIRLPDETTPADKMDLSITEDEVDLATPIYRLKLPLPHKVNVDRCRAKYDVELRKLCLTLRLKREFDYVNF